MGEWALDFGPARRPEEVAAPAGHSRMGIASFVLAILVGLGIFAIIVVLGVMETSTPGGVDESSVVVGLLGLGIVLGLLINVVGLGLGVAGAIQRRRKKLFAILGIVLNAVIFLGVLVVIVLGLSLGG